jgi:catalase
MVHSQFDRSEKVLELIKGIFGVHPTFRAMHPVGNIYRGTFTATSAAKVLTRATHFQGDPVPVTVRFSGGGGDPDAPPSTTAGMATKFYLPNGRITDLIALNAPIFVVRTADEAIGLIGSAEPDPATGKPDQSKIAAFIESVPTTHASISYRKALPAPFSFAQTNFHAVHVFRFVNAEGMVRHIRYHWVPGAGFKGQTLEEMRKLPDDFLFVDMDARIKQGPVRFTLELEIGHDDDPTDDPTALWPEGRPRIVAGHLELVAKTSLDEIGDHVMLHDPTRVTDGIELTDDPIIELRRGAYEVSVAQRTGGWHSCPFAKVANGTEPVATQK